MLLKLGMSKSNLLLPILNFFAGLIIVSLFVFFDLSNFNAQEQTRLLSTSEEYASEQSKLLRQFTDHSKSVILGLRQNQNFKDYLKSGDPLQIHNLFKYAITVEDAIMQVRFIDAKGMERVRFDRKELFALTTEITGKELQDKSNMAYVQKNLGQPEHLWLSKLELNMERGKVEVPFKPTYRIVLPVWDEDTFKGMIVINYFAQVLIDSLYKMDNYYIRIVDEQGYVLYSSHNYDNWSRYVKQPFTIPFEIKQNITSSSVITGTIATIPLNTPFENKLWFVLKPSDAFLSHKIENEQYRIAIVSIIIMIITVLLSGLIYMMIRRLNLQLKNAEAERKNQEKLFEDNEKIMAMNKLIDHYVITSTFDLDGVITDVSEAFSNICEYSKEELLGQSYSILTHPDMSPKIYEEIWKTIQADQTWTGEIKNKTKHGGFYWAHSSIAPLYDKAGKKIGYTSIREDITHAKIIEENFGELESRITTINNNSLTGLSVYDFSSQHTTYVNPKYSEITGYSLEDLEQMDHQTYRSLFYEEDRVKIQMQLQSLIEGKQDTVAEVRFRFKHKDGRWVWIHARDILLEKDKEGKPLTMLSSIMDITEFITLQENVKEKEKLLIHQSKLAAMGEMMANIAHQWKQPLMMLSMGLLALQKKYDKGTLDVDYMQGYNTKTKNLIERMNDTIQDFSEYFSPDKVAQPFDIGSCLQRSMNFLEPICKKNNIDVELVVLPNAVMVGFENELSQVILNLVQNSVDAIVEHGSDQGVITLQMLDSETHWIISISDNGGGVPEEIIHRIYEPYFTTKYKSEGTGIGLYMSKMIIEESLRGSLEVKNNEIGAVFTIQLPKGEQNVIR